MLYEIITLYCPLLSVGEVGQRAAAWGLEGARHGEFRGCWRTEFGALGRALLLRGFETAEGLAKSGIGCCGARVRSTAEHP